MLTILLLILFIIIIVFRDRVLGRLQNEQKKELDRDIFVQSDKMLNERQFNDWLDTLRTNRTLTGQLVRASVFTGFFKEESSRYLNSELRKSAEKLVTRVEAMMAFTGKHFT